MEDVVQIRRRYNLITAIPGFLAFPAMLFAEMRGHMMRGTKKTVTGLIKVDLYPTPTVNPLLEPGYFPFGLNEPRSTSIISLNISYME